MKVCVMGLGYVGFPTACLVARGGHDVIGVDVNQAIVDKLNNGELHIINEDGLGELAQSILRTGRLRISSVAEPADIFIIAVPTPLNQRQVTPSIKAEIGRPQEHYLADLSYVESASRAIAPFVQPGNLVVLESTVPPRTTEMVVRRVLEEEGVDVSTVLFAHAPERVLPGNIIHELIHNDRIVGGLTPDAGQAAREFYRTFVEGEVIITDATTAELVKLMENTFRDVNIALANEFALVCEHLGVNVWEAIQLANRHPRVSYLCPGPGVGGHCIAVDPYFVVEAAPTVTPLIQTARHVNRRMPMHILALFAELTRDIPVCKVVILGASYKANVGDERQSPSLEVAHLLAKTGVEVVIHDPYIERFNQALEVVLKGADVVVLLTDHREYEQLDPATVGEIVARRLILDTRGQLNTAEWRGAGFRVVQLGVGCSEKK